MADELLPCKECGGQPKESPVKDKFHDCGCLAFHQILYIGNILERPLRNVLINWNARNEKNNPFIEDKANGV